MSWSVCIFAHNEERLLPRCLAALDGAATGADIAVHIIENGSCDETARLARALAAADPRIHVHELALADKADAWNSYVHRIAGDEEVHIFLDGDVQPARGSFRALALALASSPRAYAAAALPTTGRSRRAWTMRLFTEHYLSGNLYAMKGAALRAFRARDLRLPVGAIGEDGLISYLLLTDLEGGEDDSHRDRIAVAGGAFFEYDSLGPNWRDLILYRRRLRRYSQRYFQNELLYALLKQKGVAAMPDYISEIYTVDRIACLTPRRSFSTYFFDQKTLSDIRRCAFDSV